jgi:hypothetical protein
MAESIPSGWYAPAHAAWLKGQRHQAIQALLETINALGTKKPLPLALQLAYYLYSIGDFLAAVGVLKRVRPYHPKNVELLLNLGVLLSLTGLHEQSVNCMKALLEIDPHNPVAFDSLASSFYHLRSFEKAKWAGTQALMLKDAISKRRLNPCMFPKEGPRALLAQAERQQVVSFSLWGDHPRYLRGALDNALQASAVYPGWTCRFYVDASVPSEIREALVALGAQVFIELPGQGLRQRLAWRFKVANDPAVGRFLVRDVDSVVNVREAWAVAQWVASDRWFHAMRDWWTHTDLLLAGMWGGVAGILPDLSAMLMRYRSKTMETPQIDQIFLRDVVWPLIRDQCLVHDRCFTAPGALGWDLPEPPDNVHVGQNVFAAWGEAQAQRLAVWIGQFDCLRLQKAHLGEQSAVPAAVAANEGKRTR